MVFEAWILVSIYYYFFLNICYFSLFYSFFSHFLMILLVGIVCTVSAIIFIYANSSRAANDEVLTQNSNQTIVLNYAKDSLVLQPQNLIYIESVGNYSHIFYSNQGQIVEKILRIPLVQIEEKLSDFSFIVRCHRAFLVNINMIDKKNARELQLKQVDKSFPISRLYRNNVNNHLNQVVNLSQI